MLWQRNGDWSVWLAFFVLGVLASPQAQGVDVTPEEQAAAQSWIAAKFAGTVQAGPRATGLAVLANHDGVLKNTRGEGRPLTIAKTAYTRGLYCHAVSHVVVRLPGPGKTFTAVVGVDSNSQTSGGRGSVVFSVSVGGKPTFRSEVLREGMAGVPVNVDLGGATEFVLDIGDAGDGISCDQADWAEAQAVLNDGNVVWLGDLPLVEDDPCATTDPPFSFVYDGRPSLGLLEEWGVKREHRELDAQRTEHTLTYTDPQTGLIVRAVAIEYHDFPTVEWTLYFRNTGTVDTPLLTDIQAIDTWFRRGKEGEFTLHHNTGSPAGPNDYQPHATPLGTRATQRIATSGGRSTNSDMPYFNVAWPGQGVIVVLGWPGQWAADFRRDDGTGLRVRGGQELTHFKLLPGEEVRTPLALVQFWKGDVVRSQNIWRRWMLAHNLPKPGGKPMPTGLMMCTSDFYPGMRSTAAEEMKYVDAYVKAGVKLDYWWVDAGWYPCEPEGWPRIGTWEPDPSRYPKGLKELADHVHAQGMKFVVWFEPERVHAGTWLPENHPEWVLGGKQGGLLDLGNAEARSWLTEHVDRMLTEQGIDLYRQDFNMDPLGYWRGHDSPDRQGITEIRHVEGYLAYWDELRRRHPDMPIDTCASGGRRNDLETLRRAVPLLRSDYRLEPVGTQGHTFGMAQWIPYFGTGVSDTSDYVVRSHWCPWLGIGRDRPQQEGLDWTQYHRMVGQWRRVAEYLLGDYYPLTSYSLENNVWMAWQFDRPELGEGVVQVFRRGESPYESARFPLRGLKADAQYTLTDLDTGRTEQLAGRQLMQDGLPITIPQRPYAAVLLYQQVR
ncbi:MAG: alpha-galactosidase [Planctomycetota bacterium]|nr:alpha-galactosidase [Planctomycetota bacterium]